ncbi:MAG TPA: hypothetical protein VKQ52_09545 [Puia sp.]|nr:hypothetical protein [Puia sp.]
MSVTFDPIINPIVVTLAVLVGVIAGFVIGKGKVAKARSTILRLENDLVHSNQETLEAQQALVALETHLQEQSSPVIPMKITGSKDNSSKEKASK